MVSLVLGGDRRMSALSSLLAQKHERVYLLAGDPEGAPSEKVKCLDYLFWLKEQPDVIFFPIPFSRDGNTLFQKAGREEIMLSHILDLSAKNTVIFGGGLTRDFLEECRKRKLAVFDYNQTDSFYRTNCSLTAKGTLEILQRPFLAGKEVLITGYGGCGKALTRLFLEQGAKVTVAARRLFSRESAAAAGAKAVSFEELAPLAESFSFIINTVPAVVLLQPFLSALNSEAVFVELVAPPGGSEIERLPKKSFQYIYAPSLPGRFFPESSAQAILAAASEMWKENLHERRGSL